jgi:hypothetical protein
MEGRPLWSPYRAAPSRKRGDHKGRPSIRQCVRGPFDLFKFAKRSTKGIDPKFGCRTCGAVFSQSGNECCAFGQPALHTPSACFQMQPAMERPSCLRLRHYLRRQLSQLHPTWRISCGASNTVGTTPMPHSPLACPSLLLSAFTAIALCALPAYAQAPTQRPGQLAPGPGQIQPSRPPGPPPQAQPAGQPGQAAQGQPRQPAPPKPYKPIPVTVAQPYNDPSFTAFRKQLSDIASRKDRAALARLVVRNFFWMGEKGDKADKKKAGIDNLAAAIDLDNKDGSGWDALAEAANEATLEPVPDRKGIMCAPANPKFDEMAADQMAKDTGTDPSEWGYPAKPDVQVRAAAKADAPVIEKLGPNLVRVMPEPQAAGAPEQEPQFLRVVTPSGKVGFVPAEGISSLETDQLCYVKDATGWKIAGFAGEG